MKHKVMFYLLMDNMVVLVSLTQSLTGTFHSGNHWIHPQILMFLINKLSLCLGPQPQHKSTMQIPGLLSGRKLYSVSFAFCSPGLGNTHLIASIGNEISPWDCLCRKNKADDFYDNVTSQDIYMPVYQKESCYQEIIPAFVFTQMEDGCDWQMPTQWIYK